MAALSNGTFETGDLTGWTDSGSTGTGDSGTQVSACSTSANHSGSYGLSQDVTANDSFDNAYSLLTQTFDSTSFDALSFWYKVGHTNVVEGQRVLVNLTALVDGTSTATLYSLLDEGDFGEGNWTQVTFSSTQLIDEGCHFDTQTTLSIKSWVEIFS
jgi:hypothetical protein